MSTLLMMLIVLMAGLRLWLGLTRTRSDGMGPGSKTTAANSLASRDDAAIVNAELSWRASTTAAERVRTKLIAWPLLTRADHRRLAALERLRHDSRLIPLRVVRAERFTRRMRDICRFELADGRQLEVAIYDPKQADRLVRTAQQPQSASLQLSWCGDLGWCCAVRSVHARGEEVDAQALAWSAEVFSV